MHLPFRMARLLAFSILVLTVRVAPVWAQSAAGQYAGRPIEDVRVLVENNPTTESALVDLIEVRIGEALSLEAVRESIAHVYSLGRFQDVQVEAAQAPGGGVALRFNLIPFHSIQRIEFKGTLGLSSGLLRDTIVERYGASPAIGRVDAAVRTLEQLYADHGYLRAKVEASTEVQHAPERALLTFTVDAGPRASIGQVAIERDPLVSREAFLRQLGASPGEMFLRPRIQERLDNYVRRLKDRRYYEAEGSLQAVPSEDGRNVDLVIGVSSGLPVNVRFDFQGGVAIPADRLKELAPLEREGSVDEDLLEDSETRIESFLRQEGYWKADVTVRREATAAAITIVFAVNRGRQYRVAGPTEITGAQTVSPAEVAALVPLKPGELFLESQLSAGVTAILAYYRQRGFAAVDVKSGVNETDPPRPAEGAGQSAGQGLVRASIVIVEGSRSTVGEVRIAGTSAIPVDELQPLVKINAGDPYFEPRIVESRDALVLEYLNRGFAAAAVNVALSASADHTRVDLTFTVQEGPQSIVDHILIVGNAHTKPEVILRELQFKSGEPLGLQDQFESRRRLSSLGLFRRVQITPLTHAAGNKHDVLVTVEEAPATSIGYGGGLEAFTTLRSTGPDGQAEEQLEFAPRGFFDIGRRNLFGANRSVNLYTRVSLRPRNAPDNPDVDGTGIEISEYRVVGTYRQPRWFGANDFIVNGVVEQGVRTTFNFDRKGVNVDVVRRLTPALRVSGRYSLSSTRTFDERLTEEDQATIDRLFPQVRLSGFSGALARDTRDDLLDPSRGSFLSGEGSLAARALGGQVGFVKTYVQGFTFHRLPGRRRVIFASRAALGLANGFPREVQPTDADGNPLPVPPVVVDDLPASERFFAGGDTTVRGFALDRVGAPNTISPDGFPTGGNAVVLLNGELRFPVWRDVGAVVFVDGGNVFRRVNEFDIGSLRGSYGFGLRYKSPVGPIRIDLGFKLDRRVIAGVLEPPTAIHFSLGQAF
jgi:outer membrane protein assembly complex protein YaeT